MDLDVQVDLAARAKDLKSGPKPKRKRGASPAPAAAAGAKKGRHASPSPGPRLRKVDWLAVARYHELDADLSIQDIEDYCLENELESDMAHRQYRITRVHDQEKWDDLDRCEVTIEGSKVPIIYSKSDFWELYPELAQELEADFSKRGPSLASQVLVKDRHVEFSPDVIARENKSWEEGQERKRPTTEELQALWDKTMQGGQLGGATDRTMQGGQPGGAAPLTKPRSPQDSGPVTPAAMCCGTEIAPGAKFCGLCGLPRAGTAYCAHCKSTVPGAEGRFCTQCSTPLTKTPPSKGKTMAHFIMSNYTTKEQKQLVKVRIKVLKALYNDDFENSKLSAFVEGVGLTELATLDQRQDVVMKPDKDGALQMVVADGKTLEKKIQSEEAFMRHFRLFMTISCILFPERLTDLLALQEEVHDYIGLRSISWQAVYVMIETRRAAATGTSNSLAKVDLAMLLTLAQKYPLKKLEVQLPNKRATKETSKRTVQKSNTKTSGRKLTKAIRDACVSEGLCINFQRGTCQSSTTPHAVKTQQGPIQVVHGCVHCGGQGHGRAACPARSERP
jgi:hypothetical protein